MPHSMTLTTEYKSILKSLQKNHKVVLRPNKCSDVVIVSRNDYVQNMLQIDISKKDFTVATEVKMNKHFKEILRKVY